MPRNLPILGVARGAFAKGLVRSAAESGVLFNGEWEEISRFVKFVNDGWAEDPELEKGWFPARIFHGVPRLHLPRTLAIMAMTTYFTTSEGIRSRPLMEGGMPPFRSWCGTVQTPAEPDPDGPSVDIREIMYVYSPGPVEKGIQTAVIDMYGLHPFRPQTGIAVVYGFAQAEGDIQGFSLPFLERDGQLLAVVQEDPPPPDLANLFLTEPWDRNRAERHMERHREMFDLSESLNRAWNRAAIRLLAKLLGPDKVLVPNRLVRA